MPKHKEVVIKKFTFFDSGDRLFIYPSPKWVYSSIKFFYNPINHKRRLLSSGSV